MKHLSYVIGWVVIWECEGHDISRTSFSYSWNHSVSPRALCEGEGGVFLDETALVPMAMLRQEDKGDLYSSDTYLRGQVGSKHASITEPMVFPVHLSPVCSNIITRRPPNIGGEIQCVYMPCKKGATFLKPGMKVCNFMKYLQTLLPLIQRVSQGQSSLKI